MAENALVAKEVSVFGNFPRPSVVSAFREKASLPIVVNTEPASNDKFLIVLWLKALKEIVLTLFGITTLEILFI